MHTLAILLMLALALVCLGVPLTATAVVYREELGTFVRRVAKALAFDPRHPGLDYTFGR